MSQAMPPPPPMSPMPYATPGMAPQRTSAAAVTSLICGILGCFVITGLIAIVTGIIGLKATKNPQVKGRGLAIAGIILGSLTGIIGGGCFATTAGVGIWAYTQMKPAIDSVNGFTAAAQANDIDKAMNYVDATRVSRTRVEEVISQLQPLGKPSGFSPTHPNIQSNNGVTTVDLDGTLEYPNSAKKPISVQLTKQADGSYKLTRLVLE